MFSPVLTDSKTSFHLQITKKHTEMTVFKYFIDIDCSVFLSAVFTSLNQFNS